jgi:hypothetical protein
MQREGIDFGETFSPTVRGEQVRLLIAIGAQLFGNKLKEIGAIKDVTVIAVSSILGVGDVRNAYLHSPLEEDNVLTELPPGCPPTRVAPPGWKVLARQVKAHPGLKPSRPCMVQDHPGQAAGARLRAVGGRALHLHEGHGRWRVPLARYLL